MREYTKNLLRNRAWVAKELTEMARPKTSLSFLMDWLDLLWWARADEAESDDDLGEEESEGKEE